MVGLHIFPKRQDRTFRTTEQLLKKNYTVGTVFGRGQLVMDADGLNTNEKAVLYTLAHRCGGDGDDEETWVRNKTVAGGAGMGVSTVNTTWTSLKKKELISRYQKEGDERTYTRVYWSKFLARSYRWKAAQRIEGTPQSAVAVEVSEHASA